MNKATERRSFECESAESLLTLYLSKLRAVLSAFCRGLLKIWGKVIRHFESFETNESLWKLNNSAEVFQSLSFESLGVTIHNFTGPRSAVVSASDCGSEGLGFESHQSHVGFFGLGRLLPRAGSAMGPMGRLEPHSRASSTSRMRLWGCCSNYLTNTAGAAVPGPG